MAWESLNGNWVIGGTTPQLKVVLDSPDVFNTGDVVTLCAVLPDGTRLFEKTGTFTPGQNTALFNTTTGDTTMGSPPPSLPVSFVVKIVFADGRNDYLKLDGGLAKNSFVLLSRPNC
jgi:hypothetical protein